MLPPELVLALLLLLLLLQLLVLVLALEHFVKFQRMTARVQLLAAL